MNDTFQEQIINLAINTFKGIDKKTGAYLQKPGVGDICQNWRFTKNGWLTRRPVYSKYNASSISANPVKYIDRIYIGTNKYLIATCNDELVVGSDSAGTTSKLYDIVANLYHQGQTYKNFHYIGNGTDSNIKTNGVAATTSAMGCQVMTAVPSAGMSAASSVLDSGLYKYKFNWEYDGYQETPWFR